MPPTPTAPFDERMLLARVGGNRALARGLLREFYVTHADVVHRIRAALGAQALDDAFRLLHRTAGTAANLGLSPLAEATGRAEIIVRAAVDTKAGGGTPGLASLNLDDVETLLHEALSAIQEAEAGLTAPAGPVSPTAPNAEQSARRADLMGRLEEQLRVNDLQALDTAAALAPFLGPEAEPLASALARLDFAEAAGILGSLTIREGEPRCPSRLPPERC